MRANRFISPFLFPLGCGFALVVALMKIKTELSFPIEAMQTNFPIHSKLCSHILCYIKSIFLKRIDFNHSQLLQS